MSGWVKLHRSIADWKWITSPNHVLVFIQILIKANFKETKWRNETILPGQILTGIKQLSLATGLSEMKTRRCLRDLAATKEITIKTTNKYSVITILNWETYQGADESVTIKQQTNDNQTTTSKKDNKGKKEKNTLTLASIDERQAIQLLNSFANRSFKITEANLRHIRARLTEGFTLSDIETVIKYKVETWGKDPKMSAYLRPETIFGTKFDSYLQSAKCGPVESDNEVIEKFLGGIA